MRVKQSRSRGKKITPAALPQRRRSKRRSSSGSRTPQPALVPFRRRRQKIDGAQWAAFIAIGLISLALIALIWTLTEHSIDDQAAEIRARTDKQVAASATVLAREIHNELALVDQSLAIVQDAWKKDPDSVDLAAWRKQLLALTSVANDIFVANERHVIVQGTLPQSVGQGFGSAYVTYPNGSLELYEPDGTKNPDGTVSGSNVKGEPITARQFLMYVLRPLDRPRGWLVGASYRSEGMAKLFAGSNLGENGLSGLIDLRRGALQAIVGSSARIAEMDIAQSELIELMRKNDSGIWAGVSPTDGVPRIMGYERVAGRDMTVLIGITFDSAYQPLAGLAAWARGLALLGSVIVVVIAGMVVWTIATARAAKARERTQERSDLDLTNARNELMLAQGRALLSEPEAGALIASQTDGVARLDDKGRLRQWNHRFAQYAGVPLEPADVGMPFETLLRRQADAGLFGDPEGADEAIGTRLTVLHTGSWAAAPLTQFGPEGEQVTMLVRGMTDGGHVVMLVGPDNARLAALPALAGPVEPEAVGEPAEW